MEKQINQKKAPIVIISALLAFALFLVSGCNTMEGMGEDMQAAGQAIEQEASN